MLRLSDDNNGTSLLVLFEKTSMPMLESVASDRYGLCVAVTNLVGRAALRKFSSGSTVSLGVRPEPGSRSLLITELKVCRLLLTIRLERCSAVPGLADDRTKPLNPVELNDMLSSVSDMPSFPF